MKNYILCGIAAIFLLAACSKSSIPSYPTNWTKNWPEDSKPVYYDSLSKVYYELQRDENNIYLHLSTKELASQIKIMRHGLSIWLDPSAQKKDKQGFTFPQAAADSAGGRGMTGRPEGGTCDLCAGTRRIPRRSAEGRGARQTRSSIQSGAPVPQPSGQTPERRGSRRLPPRQRRTLRS